MATKNSPYDDEDDRHSFGGSLGNGTLVSRRGRNTLRSNNNDTLARRLRDYHTKDNNSLSEDHQNVFKWETDSLPAKCNTSFHQLRYLVVLMAGFAMALMLMMRYSISISILKMVNQTHLYLEDHPNKTIDDFIAEGNTPGGEFNWNNEIVSIILSWYMVAYTLPQIPGTQLALKIGCHKSITIALSLCAISLMLTPMAAHMGWQYVLAMRLLNGAGASILIPVMLNIIEIWMRNDEVSLGLTLCQGVCAMMMLSPAFIGYLAQIHWVYSFYLPALFVLAFCLTWHIVVADRPEKSSLISDKELRHILECCNLPPSRQNGHAIEGVKGDHELGLDEKPTLHSNVDEMELVQSTSGQSSLVRVFKVPSFYAYLVTWTLCCCANHGYLFILPTYLRQFLKIGVADNGYYNCIISIGGIVPVIWPHLLHKLMLRSGLSLTGSRMVQQTICCFGVASTWIYVGLYHDNQILAFFINRCFFGANDVLIPGSLMSNYGRAGLSSIAFSIMNSISDILIVPNSTFIGRMLDLTGQSRQCWSWIFIALGLSHVLLWFIFVAFIDSNPIQFGHNKKNNSNSTDIEQQQQAPAQKS